MATLPAYDDGSSTESEYYFDPLEEKQEEAAYAWAHALDAVPIKQEPIPQPLEPNEEATEAFAANKAPSESSEELTLPQGSEWSHGAVVVEHSDLVERALAMASHFEQAKQKEEAMTADTVNEPSASPEKPIKKTEIRTLKKKNEVKVTQKVVSLKAVKATPPTVRTKSVAVGLMQPRKDEGLQKELERGLSVPRTTRKTTASQSSDSHKREGSLSRGKTANAKENGEEKELPKRIEQKKEPPSRGRHVSRSPSSYRKAHSKSQPRRHARSPSTRRVERASRTERSKSPARGYSRRSRSRSPSRRRVERSKSQASHYSRRSRSTSRSPSRRRGEDRRTRSRSPYRSTSPRHRHDSQRRHDHSNERNRSSSRSSRSMNERYRSRSRDRDRYVHRHDSRPNHYDGNERKSAQSSTHSRDLSPRRSSTSRDQDETSSRHRSNDYKSSRSERSSHEKGKHAATPQGGERSVGNRSRSVARLRGASTPRLQEPEPVQLHQQLSVQVAPSTAKPTPGAKRSPRDPRIRPRVEASTAPNGKPRVATTATPQPAKRFKKSTYVYHDAFERSVFRLKLQEAHLDQMLAAAQGRLGLADQRFHESRRRNIEADRARLQTENYERFEKLYSTTEIRPSDLQRYEDDRNFAKRVVQFKKKQASLQEQKDLFLSTETRDELWRRLDEDRERLLQENSVMFHKIMMDPHQGGPKHDRGAPFANGQSNERFAMGTSSANPFDSAANARVVVGASLQVQEHGLPRSFGSRRARAVNAPWFLKG